MVLTLMTLPSADNDLLMLAPSLSRSPVAPLLSALSEPAVTCALSLSSDNQDDETTKTDRRPHQRSLMYKFPGSIIIRCAYMNDAGKFMSSW